MSTTKLKFTENLWEGFDLLTKKTEIDLNQTKNVLLFFKKRAELEDQHAKKLEKLVGKLIVANDQPSDTMGNGWKKIVNVTYSESENHTLLNTHILNKVCMPFQAMIKDMEGKRKKIVNEGIKLRADMKEMIEALKKSQAKYEKVSRDLELTKLELKDAREFSDTSPDAITKLERKKERLEHEQSNNDDEYKEQIKATNDFQNLYNNEMMPKILNDFENFILQHSHLTKTYWTNWSNILKDQPPIYSQSYDGVKRLVEQIDNQNDVQEFLKKNQMKKILTTPYQYEPYIEGKLDRKKSTFSGFNTLKDQFFKKSKDDNPTNISTINIQSRNQPQIILPTASFGVGLEELMLKQKDSYPLLEVPRVLVVLAETICKLKGHVYEGIFRVPGIVSSIKEYKLRIDQNNFDLSAIDDVRTPAALFKQWLRDIPEPLIPDTLYKSAVDNPLGAVELVKKLPPINIKVITYLVHFIQIFIKYEFVAHSKMGTSNMAMIFAPTLLRCPSNDPSVLLQNVNHEKAFAENLIANLAPNPANDFLGLPVQMSDALMDDDEIEDLQMSDSDDENEIDDEKDKEKEKEKEKELIVTNAAPATTTAVVIEEDSTLTNQRNSLKLSGESTTPVNQSLSPSLSTSSTSSPTPASPPPATRKTFEWKRVKPASAGNVINAPPPS